MYYQAFTRINQKGILLVVKQKRYGLNYFALSILQA